MTSVSAPDMVFAESGIAEKYIAFRPQPPTALINKVVNFCNQVLTTILPLWLIASLFLTNKL